MPVHLTVHKKCVKIHMYTKQLLDIEVSLVKDSTSSAFQVPEYHKSLSKKYSGS